MNIDNFSIVSVTPESITSPHRFEKTNLINTGEFLSIAGSSYESIGTLLTVRSAMKHKSALPKQIIYGFIIIGAFFTIFSISIYLAYGCNTIC